MSDINRIDGNFRGLVVKNKNNNQLNMPQSGNYSLYYPKYKNISYQKINNYSKDDRIILLKKT